MGGTAYIPREGSKYCPNRSHGAVINRDFVLAKAVHEHHTKLQPALHHAVRELLARAIL